MKIVRRKLTGHWTSSTASAIAAAAAAEVVFICFGWFAAKSIRVRQRPSNDRMHKMDYNI